MRRLALRAAESSSRVDRCGAWTRRPRSACPHGSAAPARRRRRRRFSGRSIRRRCRPRGLVVLVRRVLRGPTAPARRRRRRSRVVEAIVVVVRRPRSALSLAASLQDLRSPPFPACSGYAAPNCSAALEVPKRRGHVMPTDVCTAKIAGAASRAPPSASAFVMCADRTTLDGDRLDSFLVSPKLLEFGG